MHRDISGGRSIWTAALTCALLAACTGLAGTAAAQTPPRPTAQPAGPSAANPVNPEPPATPANTEFSRIEERIKVTIASIEKSAADLNDALGELDGGISGDKARQIDSRIGEIMTAAQSALDVAGNGGLLADRLAKAMAAIEADESRIDALAQTDEQRRSMRERVTKQRQELAILTESLSEARRKALEKVNETVQLRPIIAWYARRDQTDAVTDRLKPLVAGVKELASALNSLVQFALQDPAKVPN